MSGRGRSWRRGLLVVSVFVLLPVAAVTFASPARADTFIYASPDGGGDCTSGSPCLLEQALANARELGRPLGSHVRVRLQDGSTGGVYRLSAPISLTADDSGSDDSARLIIEPDDGASPKLYGSVPVEGWTDTGVNGIWKAAVPAGLSDTRQLYVDGARATRARSVGNEFNLQANMPTGYRVLDDTGLVSWKNQEDLEVVVNIIWTQYRCPVSSMTAADLDEGGSANDTQIVMQNPCWVVATNPENALPMDTGPVAWIENAYELLDEAGEWYLDRTGDVAGDSTPAFYYKSAVDPNTLSFEAPVLESLLEMAGTLASPVEYVTVQGLTFAYATWLRPNGDHGRAASGNGYMFPAPDEGRADVPQVTPGNVALTAARQVVLERNVFEHLGGGGLSLLVGSRNSLVQGNVFRDISAQAIQVGAIGWENYSDPYTNHSLGSTVTVSSELASHPKENAIDGSYFHRDANLQGDDTDAWKSDDAVDPDPGHPWVQVVFPDEKRVEAAWVFDTVSEDQNVVDGAVTLYGAESGGVCSNQLAQESTVSFVAFSPAVESVRCARYQVTDSTGTNVGVSDFQLIERNLDAIIKDNTIKNNYVPSAAVEFQEAFGINVTATEHTVVSHNEVGPSSASGIGIGDGTGNVSLLEPSVGNNNEITNNLVVDYGQLLGDSARAGIYVYFSGPEPDSEISGNYVHSTASQVASIYLDEDTSLWTVTNNFADAPSGHLVFVHNGTNNAVQFNYSTGVGILCDTEVNTCDNNDTGVTGPPWPAAVESIVDNAGLECEYLDIKGGLPCGGGGLANGDFESGGLGAWANYNPGAVASVVGGGEQQTGDWGLHVPAPAGGSASGVSQTFAVDNGSYTVACWLRAESASDAIEVAAEGYGGSYVSDSTSSTDWELNQVPVTVTTEQITILVFRPDGVSGTGDAYADDCTIT